MKRLWILAALLCASAMAESSWNPGTKVPAGTVLLGPSSGANAAMKPGALTGAYLGGFNAWKQSVELVATTNQSIAVAAATYDGVAPLTSGTSRILLTGQGAPSQCGIWTWNGAGSALTRPTDYAAASTAGAFYGACTAVINGNTGGGTRWVITTTGAITIDTTGVTWAQYPYNLASGSVTGFLIGTNGGSGTNNGAFTLAWPASGTAALIAQNQTFTGSNAFTTGTQKFNTAGSLFKLNDSASDNTIAILTGNEVADRTLTIPLLGGNDTFATLGVSNTFTGINTVKTSGSSFLLNDSANNNTIAILTGDEVGNRTLTVPLLGGNDTFATIGLAQTFAQSQTLASAKSLLFAANGNSNVGSASLAAGTLFTQFVKSDAGTVLTVQATIPATAGTTTAGAGLSLTASAAAPGNVTPGAAAGGSVAITAGAADRLTSGNAAGGDVTFTPGAGIGTGAQGQVKIRGSDGNTDAGSTYVGESISNSVIQVSAVAVTNNNYGDITTIVLTAGDWDISAVIGFNLNAGTVTYCQGGIGTGSGTSSTGIIYGDNTCTAGTALPSASADLHISIPCYRVKITGSTTYYLKMLCGAITGTPKGYGRISARRAR